MGSNVRTAAWGPDLEDSVGMENEHSIPQGNKDLQASKISLKMYNQKKSRMNEQKIEVSHLNNVRMLYPVFRPEPGLRPRSYQRKGKPMSPCKDVRAGARCTPADRGLHEEGGQVERWPPGVRLLIIFRGLQQVSKYIEHNGSQISFS